MAAWPYIYFFRRPHRRNKTVGDSVSHSDGKLTRHRTDQLFKSLGDSVGIVDGEPVTSVVRVCHFISVGESVDIFDSEPVQSPVRVTRFESVGDSIGNIPRQNLHVSDPPFLFNSELSVCNSVGHYPSAVTDRITNGKIPSVISTSNCRHKYFVGKSVGIKRISGSVVMIENFLCGQLRLNIKMILNKFYFVCRNSSLSISSLASV